jgi:hypothetical protein
VVRGGLSTDAWGEVSTPTTFARLIFSMSDASLATSTTA